MPDLSEWPPVDVATSGPYSINGGGRQEQARLRQLQQQQDRSEALARAALIFLTIGTCGLGAVLWLPWELYNALRK